MGQACGIGSLMSATRGVGLCGSRLYEIEVPIQDGDLRWSSLRFKENRSLSQVWYYIGFSIDFSFCFRFPVIF